MTRILVVDDHEVVRRGTRQVLAEGFPGATFGEASAAPEALARLQEERWDLLVLDINLPGRSGLEVHLRLRTDRMALEVSGQATVAWAQRDPPYRVGFEFSAPLAEKAVTFIHALLGPVRLTRAG